MALREQRKLFVDEFIKLRCKNATQAAINAGYSPKSASQQACELLKNSEVLKYLNDKKSQLESDLRQEFIFEASEAFKIMHEIMNDEDAKDSDRISVAKDFLDRAGFKPQEKIEVSKPIDESIKEMEEYLCEKKKENT